MATLLHAGISCSLGKETTVFEDRVEGKSSSLESLELSSTISFILLLYHEQLIFNQVAPRLSLQRDGFPLNPGSNYVSNYQPSPAPPSQDSR